MQNLKKRDKLSCLLIAAVSITVPAMILYVLYKKNPNITKSIYYKLIFILLVICLILIHLFIHYPIIAK